MKATISSRSETFHLKDLFFGTAQFWLSKAWIHFFGLFSSLKLKWLSGRQFGKILLIICSIFVFCWLKKKKKLTISEPAFWVNFIITWIISMNIYNWHIWIICKTMIGSFISAEYPMQPLVDMSSLRQSLEHTDLDLSGRLLSSCVRITFFFRG